MKAESIMTKYIVRSYFGPGGKCQPGRRPRPNQSSCENQALLCPAAADALDREKMGEVFAK